MSVTFERDRVRDKRDKRDKCVTQRTRESVTNVTCVYKTHVCHALTSCHAVLEV